MWHKISSSLSYTLTLSTKYASLNDVLSIAAPFHLPVEVIFIAESFTANTVSFSFEFPRDSIQILFQK